MASDIQEPSYSSPPKRFKLDNSDVLCSRSSGMDDVSFSASFKVPEQSQNCDAGFSSELKRKTPHQEELNTDTNFDPTLNNHHQSQDAGIEDDDDVSSTVSNLSDLSGLSDISGQEWKPIAGPISWVQKQMLNGVNPRTLLNQMMGDPSHVPTQVDDLTLWKIIIGMLSEPPRRQRLRHINSLNDVIHLLNTCSRIIVLTGAGVSVSCGIPDFRSRDGIYSRLAVDFPNLPDPQAMFDINFFRQDPRPFFKFAREIYPGQFKPSPCHRFIKMLERHKKLLRNYTQNIDTLEQVAGINNVVECHGSFATASCTVCGHKVTADYIRKDVFQQKIPQCPVCPANSDISRGVMKPDIVFFGEGLPESFHTAMAKDKDLCDLLIVIGSSLKVRPVALIPSSIPSNVPQILINRERLPHLNFDVELYGDSDIIIDEICRMLGGDWTEVCWMETPLSEAPQLLPPPSRCGYYCEGEEAEMSVDRHETMDHEMDLPDTADLCRSEGQAKSEGEVMAVEGEVDTDEGVGEGERCLVTRRHLSMDSTRDSGIGDGSNSSHSAERHMSVESDGNISLAQRLPENSFFYLQPNRYIFPGAEVVDESDEDDDRSSVGDLSDVESDTWATHS
ncbi:NAD-dependent protein deacetylase sirtuin-1 [Macrosteles quadrilineatus]|uniref:NAD-dependent protein deacetylase sirtuin-1 n=1 Tax=Macrosteles quadrilineatus TaxID=74068 RepID=UPI0023E17376|nr:NAD-dependent protein deacetylase sirtuin-1 [Macrosteles quadrilineatus]